MNKYRKDVLFLDNIKEYTISQVEEITGLSNQTIRRRCVAGEYEGAHKIEVAGIEVWMIPAYHFDEAIEMKDALPMTRSISVAELKNTIRNTFGEILDEKLEEKIAPLREELDEISTKVNELVITSEELENLKMEIHNLDGKLDIDYHRHAFEKKSWWRRIKDIK